MLVDKRVTGWAVEQFFGLPSQDVFIREIVTVDDTATDAEIADEALIQCDRFLHFVKWLTGPVIVDVKEEDGDDN